MPEEKEPFMGGPKKVTVMVGQGLQSGAQVQVVESVLIHRASCD